MPFSKTALARVRSQTYEAAIRLFYERNIKMLRGYEESNSFKPLLAKMSFMLSIIEYFCWLGGCNWDCQLLED
jgi:hypothetical protein